MTNLSKKIIQAVEEIGVPEINEGLSDQLGLNNLAYNVSQAAKSANKEFGNDFKNIAKNALKFGAKGAIEFATGDADLANKLVDKVSKIYKGMVPQNVNNIIKKFVSWGFVGSFKGEESLISGISNCITSSEKVGLDKSNFNEDRFLKVLFYFAASKNFSNLIQIQQNISVEKFIGMEQEIISNPILQGTNLKKLNSVQEEASQSKLEKALQELINQKNNSDIIKINRISRRGKKFVVDFETSINQFSTESIKFFIIKNDGKSVPIKDTSIKLMDAFKREIEINEDLSSDLFSAGEHVSKGEDFKIIAYISTDDDKYKSNFMELDYTKKSSEKLYKSINSDINYIINNLDNIDKSKLSSPSNIDTIPYYLASIGMCSSSEQNDKVVIDFSPIISVSSLLSSEMISGVFKKSNEFKKIDQNSTQSNQNVKK